MRSPMAAASVAGKLCVWILLALAPAGFGAVVPAGAPAEPAPRAVPKPKRKPTAAEIEAFNAYREVVRNTEEMVWDDEARELALKQGLGIVNLTWEDTARFEDSCVGPNISDVTIQVQQQDPQTGKYTLDLMPVIRHPNYSDKTADISPKKFYLLVGNEKKAKKGGEPELTKVSLYEFLRDLRGHLTKPGSWKGRRRSMLCRRDSHVLVSAQACFLPVPKGGKAPFNPVIFNYQSEEGDPAVLTILATREGTSVTVIDNKRDAFEAGDTWGQRLFFNAGGMRASLTGERLSDFADRALGEGGGDDGDGDGDSADLDTAVNAGSESALNMVLLIQVPLRKKKPKPRPSGGMAGGGGFCCFCAVPDVEDAVIGHGELEGPFTEIDGLPVRRDTRYPIRVTVQFYKATSNGKLSEADAADIAGQLGRVYSDGDYVGSLVTDGPAGRPTEYDAEGASKKEPPEWWNRFWLRHERNTGNSRAETMKMLRKSLGPNWMPHSRKEMESTIRSCDEGAF